MQIDACYEITRLGYAVGVSISEGDVTHRTSKLIPEDEVRAYRGALSRLLQETAATLLRDLWLSLERAKSETVQVGHRDLSGAYSFREER